MTVAEILIGLLAQLTASFAESAPTVYREALERHYERVELELRRFEPPGLDITQRFERARAIEHLRSYRLAADFGHLPREVARRSFGFVDADGRRCAVAYLLDATGASALTLEVAHRHNQALVAELAADPALGRWLARHGLTLFEAARIQGPLRQPPPWTPPPSAYDRRTDPNRIEGQRTSRPAPQNPTRPGGGARGGAMSGPSTPSGGRTAGMAGSSLPAPGAYPGLAVGFEVDWIAWWRWHRARLLENGRGSARGELATPGSSVELQGDGVGDGRGAERAQFVQHARRLLAHRDGEVRRAAVFALGLTGGGDDLDALLALREDPRLEVRQEALLALGALDTPRATHALFRLALQPNEADAMEQAFAVVGLAVARAKGERAAPEGPLASLLAARSLDPLLEEALVLAQGVAPTKAVEDWLRTALDDEQAPLLLRCRAAEALSSCRDTVTLAALVRALGGRHPDLRASAANGLGAFVHELVLPSLLTAFEVEREQSVRGLLLIAIGRQGGEHARAFLLEELRRGGKALRPWAALGLGLLARGAGCTPEIAAALAEAGAASGVETTRQASLLARGLARDPGLPAAVEALLREKPSAESRLLAGAALAADGSAPAHACLRRAVDEENCPTTRQMLAIELAEIAASEDQPTLRTILAEVLDPALRVSLTRALGRRADAETRRALVDELADAKREPRFLAGRLEAAGWALAHRDAPVGFAWTARFREALFPSWASVAIQRSF